MSADTISGGSPIVSAPLTDSWYNFTMIDTTNPINGYGTLNSWSIYAGNTNQVELLIFSDTISGGSPLFTLVGASGLVTPVVGANTFTLSSPIAVTAGDVIGFYFPGLGSIDYTLYGTLPSFGIDNVTGEVLWNQFNGGLVAGGVPSGIPGDTEFVWSGDRTYSIDVTGTGTLVPEPTTLMLLGGGLSLAGLGPLAQAQVKKLAVTQTAKRR